MRIRRHFSNLMEHRLVGLMQQNVITGSAVLFFHNLCFEGNVQNIPAGAYLSVT